MFMLKLYNDLKQEKRLGLKKAFQNLINIVHKLRINKAVDSVKGILNQSLHCNVQLKCSSLVISITEWGDQKKNSSLSRYCSQKFSKSFLFNLIYEKSVHNTFKEPAVKVGKPAPHLAQCSG